MTDKREYLIKNDIFKLMLNLSIPGIVGMLVVSLYSFVDGMFVGKFISGVALGAIGLAYSLTLINNGIAVLIGIGSASVLSRAVGREDQKTLDSIMGNVLILTFLFSLLTTVFGYIFAPNLLHLIGADGEMLNLGTRYLRIIFLGSFFVNFGQAANMVMRGEGKMILAMVFMGISAVLNIILDAVFIIVFEMGIEGAAIATIISQIVLAICNFTYFLYFDKVARFKTFKLDKSIVGETLGVGISAMFMQVFSLIQQAVMFATLKKYGGENQVILMTACFRYMMLSFIPVWGISQGFQPFAGTNFGAKEFERVKKGTIMFIKFSLIIALISWIAFLVWTKQIMGLFINDYALIESGITNARLSFLVFPLTSIMIINLTLCQATGKAKAAGLLVVGRQLALYIPAMLIIPIFFGVRGAWCVGTIVDALITIISIIVVIGIFKKDLAPVKAE